MSRVRTATAGFVLAGALLVGCGSDADDADVDDAAVAVGTAVDEAAADAEAGAADLAQTLRDNGLDSAAGIVDQIDVDELIAGEQFTFFAPSDEAFTALGADEAADLLADPTMALDVLRNHVLDERLTSAELAEATSVETVAGETLEVSVDGDVLTVDGVAVVSSDIEVGDGVVHVVDEFFLMP